MSKMRCVGIDASNLRGGGGRTHLIELLHAARPRDHGIDRVIVWASRDTLDLLEDRDWLAKRNPAALNAGLLRRSLWQRYRLPKEAHAEACDVLFVPGGSYAGNFHPMVTISQNMLPFEWPELRRYGWTWTALRILLLRQIQSASFRRAEGVVFLTEYARDAVQRVTGKLHGSVKVIPHGLNRRFSQPPRAQHAINTYTTDRPLRLLYGSIVEQYKHQWAVVEAVGRLRARTHWPMALHLVGPSYPPALARLNRALDCWDPDRRWVRYHGGVPYQKLHEIYQQADVGLFASSCENMPNILLEIMAAGLPIACSDRGPMPEVLGDAGVYFDPLTPASIEQALERLVGAPELREALARAGYTRAQAFSWDRCAEQTFGFLAKVSSEASTMRRRR